MGFAGVDAVASPDEVSNTVSIPKWLVVAVAGLVSTLFVLGTRGVVDLIRSDDVQRGQIESINKQHIDLLKIVAEISNEIDAIRVSDGKALADLSLLHFRMEESLRRIVLLESYAQKGPRFTSDDGNKLRAEINEELRLLRKGMQAHSENPAHYQAGLDLAELRKRISAVEQQVAEMNKWMKEHR